LRFSTNDVAIRIALKIRKNPGEIVMQVVIDRIDRTRCIDRNGEYPTLIVEAKRFVVLIFHSE